MKKVLAAATIVAVFLFLQCSDDTVAPPGAPPGDMAGADSVASHYFQALADTIGNLGGKSEGELRNLRFDPLRAGFNESLARDGGNGVAHLGLSILEILELNYDEDIWALVDSIGAWQGNIPVPPPLQLSSRHNTLVGRQFALAVEVPFYFSTRIASSVPSTLTLHHIQTIIKDKMMPALVRTTGHLETVERRSDTGVRVLIDDSGVREYIYIDLGEILIFHASVQALLGAFGMGIAYDVDLYGPDGTYDWLDDMNDIPVYYQWCPTATLHEAGAIDSLTLDWHSGKGYALQDSILTRVMHYNLATRTAFLSMRDNGQAIAKAGLDMRTMLDKLEAAADHIRNRSNPTEESVIKLADLTDLDSDIAGATGKPNFAQNFDSVEDVIGFMRQLLSGPVDFTENIGAQGQSYSWRMDLGKLFTNPVQDWNDLLPYHRWNLPSGAWITRTRYFNWEFDNGGGFYSDYFWVGDYCEYRVFDNIGWVRSYGNVYEGVSIDMAIEFLDDPGGNVIDPSVEFPYFPDYTFNGVFPLMNRDSWVDLLGILQ